MFKNISLKIKLVLTAIASIITLATVFMSVNILIQTIQEYKDAERKIAHLNSGMLTLRKNEKDFLTRKDIKYVKTFEKNTKKIYANIQYLEEFLVHEGFDKFLFIFLSSDCLS